MPWCSSNRVRRSGVTTNSFAHVAKEHDPDLKTGKERAVMSGAPSEYRFGVFSPDGKTLATSLNNGIALIWIAVEFNM